MKGDYKTRLEREQTKMCKDIDHIKSSIDKIEDYIKEDREWKDNFQQRAQDTYATKEEAQTIRKVIAGIITVGLASIGGILTFIGTKLL